MNICQSLLILALLLFMAGEGGAKNSSAARPPQGETSISDVATPNETPKLTSGQIQLKVMDFSDQYVAALWSVMDDYIRKEPDASKRVTAQSWKVLLGSSSMAIAASIDPRTNLLDMAIFISVGKWAVNRYWIPKVFGERANGSLVYTKIRTKKYGNYSAKFLRRNSRAICAR
ncbi:MAG: hypothetical protein ABIP97_13160 [Chthoniobacterales bacterium]